MRITLKRVSQCDEGTCGVLIHNYKAFAVTFELAWHDNKRNESCIPTGIYDCKLITSPLFGRTYQIMGVEKRGNILFHRGNTTYDTRGCILVGEMFEPVNGKHGIQFSGKGYGEFMRILKDCPSFELDLFSV